MELIAARKNVDKVDLFSFRDEKAMYNWALHYVFRHRNRELGTCFGNILRMSEKEVTEEDFTMEYLFSIYVSGFKASVISSKFEALAKAHRILSEDGKFVPVAKERNFMDTSKMGNVKNVFANLKKGAAVQTTRSMILLLGWDLFHETYIRGLDPEKLGKLPLIGEALSCHLARNLGNLEVVKPDVHLKRLAKHYGFSSPLELCRSLSSELYPPAYIDLVLWLVSVDMGTQGGV